MIIRYDSNETSIQIVNRFKIKPSTIKKYADVGARTLPINLEDVFNKGKSIISSKIVTSVVYIINNNNIKDNSNNNINNNNIYNKCHNFATVLEDLKTKARNNLVDVHFFPVRYKGSNKKKEMAYVDYNLRWSLVSMLEMEQALQWLIGYNSNVQFIVENRDIVKTLWSVANRLSNDNEIKSKCVSIAMNIYNNGMDAEFISSKFQNFWWNVDWFIGYERYIKHITGYEMLEKNTYVGIYLYGSKREDAWRNVTHRYDLNMHLYIDNQTKMMLKRVKNTMTGHEFHKYLNDLIGKWFDLSNEQIWSAIRQNMRRIDDTELNEAYDVETCKLYIKSYFTKLGEICYDGELITEVNNENT